MTYFLYSYGACWGLLRAHDWYSVVFGAVWSVLLMIPIVMIVLALKKVVALSGTDRWLHKRALTILVLCTLVHFAPASRDSDVGFATAFLLALVSAGTSGVAYRKVSAASAGMYR